MKMEKQTRQLLFEIDNLIRIRVFPRLRKPTNWRTINQDHAYKIKKTIMLFSSELERLSGQITPSRKAGRISAITADQKVKILLVKQLMGESNRNMVYLLVIFSALSGIFLGYKSIERFYLDKDVYFLLLQLKDFIINKY